MFTYLPPGMKLYIWVLAFLLGAVMGSAMNCLAFRLAQGRKWGGGRSACPHCGHILAAKDLVPLLSYLVLKGKCRYCGAKLAVRYVLAEAFLGLCYVAVMVRFRVTPDGLSALVLVTCLFALSMVDLDIQIIPDRFLLIPAAVRVVQLATEGRLLGGLLPGLIFGGGLLLLSLVMDWILKKDSMGGGDIKLMGVLGFYFSIPECLLLVIIACILGIGLAKVTAKEEDGTFPFGPALSLAALVTMLVGEYAVYWYLTLL